MKKIMTVMQDIKEDSFLELRTLIKNAFLDLEGGIDKFLWSFVDIKNNSIFAGLSKIFFDIPYQEAIESFEEIPPLRVLIPKENEIDIKNYLRGHLSDDFGGCSFDFRNENFYLNLINEDFQIQLPVIFIAADFLDNSPSEWDLFVNDYSITDMKNNIGDYAFFELLKSAVVAASERVEGSLIDTKGAEVFCENALVTKELTENGLKTLLIPVDKQKDIWKKSLTERVSKNIDELFYSIFKKPLTEKSQLSSFSSFSGLVSLLKEKDEHFKKRTLRLFENNITNHLKESSHSKNRAVSFLRKEFNV